VLKWALLGKQCPAIQTHAFSVIHISVIILQFSQERGTRMANVMCYLCGLWFEEKDDLRDHMERIHPETRELPLVVVIDAEEGDPGESFSD
jgi:hypothetical protein